ncbi:hypothetical protein WJX84_000497 [Apatococcus fuscideae]|uniref:Ribosome-recycling factor, chloroplastic n=1 Tax=Apatococcus fuscideae TaxID=2026836 RepID=A0AAW1TGB8_9CHLO
MTARLRYRSCSRLLQRIAAAGRPQQADAGPCTIKGGPISTAVRNWGSLHLQSVSLRYFAKASRSGTAADNADPGPNMETLSRSMDQSVRHLHDSLASLRSGRASPGLLDNIKVDAYGEKVPFKSIAACTVREAQLLVVTAFDPGTIQSIAKAIAGSPLSLNPRVDGSEILVPVPRPDKDSLKGISKMIQGEVEKAKQSVRRLRKGAMDDCKALTSKDDKRRQEKQVQELTDSYISKAEDIASQKEAQLATA